MITCAKPVPKRLLVVVLVVELLFTVLVLKLVFAVVP
jgi:hypothetical protein